MKRCLTGRKLLAGSTVSLVLFCVFVASAGQEPSEYTIHSDVRLVLLDVSVKGRNGNPVSGLTAANFAIFENGSRQQITVFAHNDIPVTVGILVDESLSMRPKRNDVLLAAQTFIQESNPHDEIFVLNFNDTVARGLPKTELFSDNINQLRSALYRGTPEGKTALFDAIADGLGQLEMGRRDKKTLIVISDGGDNASGRTRREVLDLTEGTIATVYAIGIYEADDPDQDPGILRELAKISGGEAYFPQDPALTTSICRRIANDIRTRYTLGYTPQAENGKGALRRIRVSVSAPGDGKLIARTRSSYRYDETSKPASK